MSFPVTFELTDEEKAAVDIARKGKSIPEFIKSIVLTSPAKIKRAKKTPAPESEPQADDAAGEIDAEKTRVGIALSVQEELRAAGDRHAGIIGGAFLDDALAQLLEACWRQTGAHDYPGGLAKEAFGHSGPLGSFRSRIVVCRVAGIIGPQTHGDLDAIREIRNICAHWQTLSDTDYVPMSFAEPAVKKWCAKLVYADKRSLEFGDGKPLRPDTMRNRFVLSVILIGAQLAGGAALVRRGMPAANLKNYLP